MDDNRFFLYGANGYTGRLIARYAGDYGLEPMLAGRREDPLKSLSRQLNLPYQVIDLDDQQNLEKEIKKFKVVAHAAGPFQFTAKEMLDACVKSGTHYADINGDISVFEMIKQYDSAAKNAGIMILPGAGFDVVPTDCTALLLKKMLPDAIDLKLAFASVGGGLSHGTATTMVNKLGEGGTIRRNGKIIRVPLAHKGFRVDFGKQNLFVASIPWGDISTAYFTTSIPNIETFAGMPVSVYNLLKFQSSFNWLLRTSPIRNFIKRKIDSRAPGPTDEMRARAKSLIWGQVTNVQGHKATARLEGPDGYTLTAHSTLITIRKVLSGDFKPGYQTPASAYGADLVMEIPGVHREIL